MSDTLYNSIGQFVTIPFTVVEMWAEIGMDAFGLFVYLRYRSGAKEVAWPSYDDISAGTGMTRERISAAIKTLEEYELLIREKRFGGSTRYYLQLPSRRNVRLQSSERPTTVVGTSDANKIHATSNTEQDSSPPAADNRNGRAQRIVESVTRGAARRFDLEMEIQNEFHINPNWGNKTNKDVMDWLVQVPPGQKVADFARWWRTQDWRGKQGQPPTLALIRELWPQAFVTTTTTAPIEGVPPDYDPEQDEKLQEYLRSRMK